MSSVFTRRTVMAGGASLLALASVGNAKAQGKPKFKLSLAVSETDLRAEGYKAFAAAMKDDFELEPYWGNTLFKQGTELVALQRDNLRSAIWRRPTFPSRFRPGRCSPPPICSATTRI